MNIIAKKGIRRMSNGQETEANTRSSIGWKLTLLICILMFLAGAGIVALIYSTEPTAVRSGATKKSDMLVQVTKGQRGTFRPIIEAMGTVVPARDLILRPRVSGEIVELSQSFTPGGYVIHGQTLLRIDPSDYINTLEQRKSQLRQAIADKDIEMGRQYVAKQDYLALKETLSQEREILVLRQPQLRTVQARIDSAQAALNQAELELARTNITAPFDAHILSRNVNLGSQVSAGDNLGRLVGLNTYWVEVTVPVAQIRWLSFPDDSPKAGSKVRIRNRSAWPEGVYRHGSLYRLVGALEEQTRMARVLVTVDDPLARRKEDGHNPAMILGSFVEARIETQEVKDVIRLERRYIRNNDTVWIMKNDRLDIREVEIVFRNSDYAYIQSGMEKWEQVVTTNLTTVVQGAKLHLKKTETPPPTSSGAVKVQ